MGYGDFVLVVDHWTMDVSGQNLKMKSPLSDVIFYHCVRVPDLARNKGKYIAVAMENMGQDGVGGLSHLIAQFPVKPICWTPDNEILVTRSRYDSSWKEGATAWLEGDAVVF